MFEKKIVEKIIAVFYIALAFMMYTFLSEMTYIGGIGFSFRHLFALGIVVCTFIAFIIVPNVKRAVLSIKMAIIYSAPSLLSVVVSLFIWMVQKSDSATILRGISGAFFFTSWVSFALAAVAFIYLFGENGIWYNLAAILAANLYAIIMIMATDGVGPFMTELWQLIISFADNTGDIIVKAEIHELAFSLGAYLLYMIIKPKKKAWFFVLFGLSLFCFVCALKRIAIIAMVAALAIRLILLIPSIFSKKAVCRAANIIMILSCAVLVLYIYAIHADVFTMLEKAGISTSGRDFVYSQVSRFYEFSPSYLGRGIGYLTYQLNESVSLGVTAVHNDFLQYFIDLGFWGYLIWIVSMTYMRTRYFGSHNGYDSDTAVVTCVLLIYLLVSSSTDNTINYPLLTMTLGVIMMGNGFEKRLEEQSGDKLYTAGR